MKSLLLSILLLLFFVPIVLGKPSLPLQINAELTNDPLDDDGVVTIRVHVTSSMDISEITVLCQLPSGLTLSKGEYEWRGNIKQGELKELFYTLSVHSDTYYKVEFWAKMDAFGIEGSVFSIVEINPLRKKVELRSPEIFKKLPDGNLVIETKGE